MYLSISDKSDTFYMDKHFDDTQPNGRLLTMSGKCYITEPVHTAGVTAKCRYTIRRATSFTMHYSRSRKTSTCITFEVIQGKIKFLYFSRFLKLDHHNRSCCLYSKILMFNFTVSKTHIYNYIGESYIHGEFVPIKL